MVALDQPVMTDEQVGCSTRNAPALCSLSRSLGGTGQEGRKKKKNTVALLSHPGNHRSSFSFACSGQRPHSPS